MKITPLNELKIQACSELYHTVWQNKEERFSERFQRQISYQGFDGYVAQSGKGEIIGFVYGYQSLPGQFYHGVLSQAVSADAYEKWLSDCFEIVELVVNPAYRRQGNGKKLLERLLKNKPMKTGVLTTQVENIPAKKLYQSMDFEEIIPSFYPMSPNEAYTMMGKILSSSE